jgi:PAS domain S-box-containing protein
MGRRTLESGRAGLTVDPEREFFPGDADWLRALLDAALDAVISVDHEGKVIGFNRAAREMFGYPASEALGKPLADLVIPPSLRERHRQAFARVIATGESRVLGRRLQMTAIGANGREFPVELTITRLDLPGPPIFSGFVRDLSEQKRTEDELRLRVAQLTEAQLLANIGRGEWDPSTNVIRWTGSSFWLARRPPTSPSGPPFEASPEVFLERVHPDDRKKVSKISLEALRDGRPFAFDHRVMRDDGAVLTIEVRGQVVLDEQGVPAKVVFVALDVTDRIRGEQRLKESAEALRRSAEGRRALLTRLAAAHEEERSRLARELHDGLGQALTSLSLFAKDLENDADPDLAARLTSFRKEIEQAIATARSMAWSLRPAALDRLGLIPALEELLSHTREHHGLNVNLHVSEGEIGFPREAETAIYRIVQEALTNVIKHAHANHASVVVSHRRGTLTVIVEDDGTGFQPDRVAEYGGPGERLGLLDIRERAEALGGRVDIESTPGKSTTVRVLIPTEAVEGTG